MSLADAITKSGEFLFSDTINMVKIDFGFCVIILNSATIYLTVSMSGTMRTHIVGELHQNIKEITYQDGIIKIIMNYTTSFGCLIYTPHGKILL